MEASCRPARSWRTTGQGGPKRVSRRRPGACDRRWFQFAGATHLTTRFGSPNLVDINQLDSWGRVTAEIRNYVAAGPTDPQTNVRTGHVFDLDGRETDRYQEGTASGTWVISHFTYDNDGNQLSQIQNYVSGQPETVSQNVTTAYSYDVQNRIVDETRPQYSAGGATVLHRAYDSSGASTASRRTISPAIRWPPIRM